MKLDDNYDDDEDFCSHRAKIVRGFTQLGIYRAQTEYDHTAPSQRRYFLLLLLYTKLTSNR